MTPAAIVMDECSTMPFSRLQSCSCLPASRTNSTSPTTGLDGFGLPAASPCSIRQFQPLSPFVIRAFGFWVVPTRCVPVEAMKPQSASSRRPFSLRTSWPLRTSITQHSLAETQ